MSNQVYITSKHIIKPSSPTPPHLKTFKLSLLNQLIRPDPTPIHLFFRPTNIHDETLSHRLRHSLATVLTRFYPLAGIIVNNTHIDCNDIGAIYYEARVDCPMSHFLENPPNGYVANALKLVIPKMDDQNLITVIQVTTFSCGSLVICAALSHKIADAAACATFLNCWGAITRGAVGEIKGIVVDSCHVFPPLDPSRLGIATKASPNYSREISLATKLFVFTPKKISALQNKLTSENNGYRPSRIVALTTLIWGSYIRVVQRKNGPDKLVKHLASHVIDFRGRVHPNLPGDSLDNVVESSMGTEYLAGSTNVDFSKIATLVYKDIKKYDDPEFVKRIHVDGSYVNRRAELVLKSISGEIEWFKFTSNLRVPFYDADFGWGPPCWAISALIPVDKLCVLLDGPPSSSGNVEAWVTLVQEDMNVLERDPFFMAFVDPSCHPVSNKSKL